MEMLRLLLLSSSFFCWFIVTDTFSSLFIFSVSQHFLLSSSYKLQASQYSLPKWGPLQIHLSSYHTKIENEQEDASSS